MSMTTQQLQTKLGRYNALHLCFGSVLVAIAPAFWFGSFWFARYLFWLPLALGGVRGMWGPSLYVAWAFTALLAFEGLRGSRPLFDLMEYSVSDFNFPEHPGSSVNRQRLDPLAYAWFVVQVLFVAPRTTILAIQYLQGVVRVSSAEIERATAIFNELEDDRRWRSVRAFGDCGPEVHLPVRLELIWFQRGATDFEIRFPAAMTEEELV
jgi:hypothetical protein